MKTMFVLSLLCCVSVPAWGAQRPHLLEKFDHEMHTGFFESAEGISCETCHPAGAEFGRDTVDLRGCHRCHNNPKDPPIPATNDCNLCHGPTLQPLKPHSHTKAWQRVHPAVAKRDAAQCATCHGVSDCVDCHQQRDTVRETMHRRNFRFFHSIEARANPARCDRCHTVNYCTECHQTRRLP